MVTGWGDQAPSRSGGGGATQTSSSCAGQLVADTAVRTIARRSTRAMPRTPRACSAPATTATRRRSPTPARATAAGRSCSASRDARADYVLAGLVDSGRGLRPAGLPGHLHPARRHRPPDLPAAHPTSTAGAAAGHRTPPSPPATQPGQTLTCDAGPRGRRPSADVRATSSSTPPARQLTPLRASGTTYTIQASDCGTSIFCEPKATNDGGYGLRPQHPLASCPRRRRPPPPPAPRRPVRATRRRRGSSVLKKSCTKTQLHRDRVSVRDAAPSSGHRKGQGHAALHAQGQVQEPQVERRQAEGAARGASTAGCARRPARTACSRSCARHLRPGTGYTITLLPFDKAGNRPQFSTITSVRTKKLHPFFLF